MLCSHFVFPLRSPFSPFSPRHHQRCLCLPALMANVYSSNDEVVEWVVSFFLSFLSCLQRIHFETQYLKALRNRGSLLVNARHTLSFLAAAQLCRGRLHIAHSECNVRHSYLQEQCRISPQPSTKGLALPLNSSEA